MNFNRNVFKYIYLQLLFLLLFLIINKLIINLNILFIK